MAKELRNLGVITEVVKTIHPEMKKGYRLTLLDAGSKKLEVAKAVIGITGLGLKEAKELVDNLDVLGVYKVGNEMGRINKIKSIRRNFLKAA